MDDDEVDLEWLRRQLEELLGRKISLDLIGYAEAAPILGVTRQGVRYLAENDRQFPKPVSRPLIGPVYLRSHIEAYQKLRHDRDKHAADDRNV